MHSGAIGIDDSSTLHRRETQSRTGESGVEETTVVYDEEQDGHRVYGAEVRVIVRGGDVVYAGGNTSGETADLGEASFDADDAYAMFNASSPETWTMDESELVAFNLGVLIRRSTRSVLAWMLDVRDGAEPWRVFVDAQTGAEILRLPRFGHAYASETYSHLGGTETLTHMDGELVEGIMATPDATAADGYGRTVYDYYDNTLGRDSYDDAGAKIITRVDLEGYNNATWNGVDLSFDPQFLALDVFGHEFGHAVVEHTAGLEYAFESGALNESLADLFGEFAAAETTWLIGENTPYGTLRSFSSPGAYGQPAHYRHRFAYGSFDECSDSAPCEFAGERCVTGICLGKDFDEGGVHYNSGITNYAFYLLTEGGSGTESGVDVMGIGREKVEQLVYRTLVSTLGPSSGFLDFRFGLQTTALAFIENEEHGFTYADCGAVLNAMAAVGVGAPDRDSDCFDDEADNCPCVYNPEQNADDCDGSEECGPQCSLNRTCDTCGVDDGCGWCDGACYPESAAMDCSANSFDAMCEADECESLALCGDCSGVPGCAWCEGVCESDASDCHNYEGRVVPYIHADLCPLVDCPMEDSCDSCRRSACTWCDGRCTALADECDQSAPTTCEPAECNAARDCGRCTLTPGCGWGPDGCVEAGTEGSSTSNALCVCDRIGSCEMCVEYECAWTTGSCGALPTDDSATTAEQCEGTLDPCAMAATDCTTCAQTAGCGWGSMGCVTAPVGSPGVVTRAAECFDCSGLMGCTSCASNGFCEWCPGSGCHNTYEDACTMPTPVLECG